MDNNNTIVSESYNNNDLEDIAWEAGANMYMMDNITPLFKNLKEEVLNNKFASISKLCWNDTLRKCQAIYKGQVESTTKKEWSQQMKENNIGLKEFVALKLYCDFDDLQREFRKCFRSPYNLNKDRLSSFYWWNNILTNTFTTFNQIKSKKKYNLLFHGVSSVMCIDKFKGKCFGPLSCSTDINVARSFAGKSGMILVIAPVYNEENAYFPFDISLLSEFPDECEVLCFDQSYCIKNVILANEFDQNFHIYDSMYNDTHFMSTGTVRESSQIGEPDHEVDEFEIKIFDQNERIKWLHELSESIANNHGHIKMKYIIQFLFQFIFEYINNELPTTNFDEFIDSNIKYMTRNVNHFSISTKLLKEIINNKPCDMCINQIKNAFTQYFACVNVQFV